MKKKLNLLMCALSVFWMTSLFGAHPLHLDDNSFLTLESLQNEESFSISGKSLNSEQELDQFIEKLPLGEEYVGNLSESAFQSRLNQRTWRAGYVHFRIYRDPSQIGKRAQFATLSYISRGQLLAWDAFYVSTGMPHNDGGDYTPVGHFTVDRIEDVSYRSNSYPKDDQGNPPPPGKGAPMPFAIFFKGGMAAHHGYVTGAEASHGCVRLPRIQDFARMTGKYYNPIFANSLDKARLLNLVTRRMGGRIVFSVYGQDRKKPSMSLSTVSLKPRRGFFVQKQTYLNAGSIRIPHERSLEEITQRLQNPSANSTTGFSQLDSSL